MDLQLPVEELGAVSAEEAAGLLASIASEPHETRTFEKPIDEGECTGNGSDPAEMDGAFAIRNLDTGETYSLTDCELNKNQESQRLDPQVLSSSPTGPWRAWWAEKHRQDERLWSAAGRGCLEELQEALRAVDDGGPMAEVNSQSLHRRTALHIAASGGHSDCVEALLNLGAYVDARTDMGLTPLHLAAGRGYMEPTRLLLDAGADALAEAEDGSLSLHLAAAGGHALVVEMLLERGGERQLRARNRLGQRPSEVAMDIETAALFQQHGAGTPEGPDDSPASGQDRYAGRTPFHEGAVLLHNARADVVRRLLHRQQRPPDHAEDSQEPGTPVISPNSSQEVRRPFVRLRKEDGVERAGPDDFNIVKVLGRGSFGEVFQVQHKRTYQEYAMKILRKNKVARGNLLRYAMTERNILSYVRHPYIVSLHYAFQTSTYLVLVLELCPCGNMQSLIHREKRLSESLARLYSAEVLLALEHLHERNIVFRDLKPENVVLDSEGHCKLTDFGLSKEEVEGLKGTRSFCGSLAFLAPEILQRQGHGHTVDIYGLGVLLFAMLTGMPPFYHSDRNILFENISSAPLHIPSIVGQDAGALIRSLMEREPERRLGASRTKAVEEHNFFAGLSFEALMRRQIPMPEAPASLLRNSRPLRNQAGQPESPFSRADRGAGGLWRTRGTPCSAAAHGIPNWSFSTAAPGH